ncbi:MAG: hypothetical protein NWF07_06125 [Candidatus Bathyarchaeota archaeon]|nr:hypothetical protein [Candidatus Bathyarchaeota archaeon]
MSVSENTVEIRRLFSESAKKHGLRGVLGITRYEPVFDTLMPVQKERLKAITGDHHQNLIDNGFFVSIAYAYPDGIIENIGLSKDGVFDKASWNVYAEWYKNLNKALNETSKNLAKAVNGTPLPATSEGMASQINTVKDYFPTVVSHRVHAEHAGIGWRGRNSLIINPVYSCMIRLAGVITLEPLIPTQKMDPGCGECSSCLDVCSFLRHRDRLDDYREQCLAYMNWLGLDDEVCGKCIKACVNSPIFDKHNKRVYDSGLDCLYYTETI